MNLSILTMMTLLSLPEAHQDTLAEKIDAALLDARPLQGIRSVHRLPHRRVELGALIDVQQKRSDGLAVRELTAGSFAERVGLKPGDQLLVINSVDLTDASFAVAEALELALATWRNEIDIELRRDGQHLRLVGAINVLPVPGFVMQLTPEVPEGSGCGYLASADTRSASHKVVIESVNGRPVRPDWLGRIALPSGLHRLTVRPLAPNRAGWAPDAFPRFSEPPSLSRQMALRFGRSVERLATLEVTVAVSGDRLLRLGAERVNRTTWAVIEIDGGERRCRG